MQVTGGVGLNASEASRRAQSTMPMLRRCRRRAVSLSNDAPQHSHSWLASSLSVTSGDTSAIDKSVVTPKAGGVAGEPGQGI